MNLLIQKIKSLSNTYFDEVRSYRRHLHSNPELSFQEFETAVFVAAKLDALGVSYKKGIAKTGIVAIIEGKNASKKTVALRADMDALPITETNTTDYISKNIGVMHACGHDAHTSCLLGAAKILHALRDDFEGTVKLIFQPSEEKSPGGASVMIQEGVLHDPEVVSIFGQHVYTPLEAGKVAFCFGNCMAACDEIYIKIIGKGGHAAFPQDVLDPIMMAAQLLVTLQQVVSRLVSPFDPIVLSFGKIVGMGASNVIPDTVQIDGTLRTMSESVRAHAHRAIQQIVEHTISGLGGQVELVIEKGYPVVTNEEALTRRAYQNAIDYVGKENVFENEPRMGAEDFAFYSQKIPACFYRIGTGNPSKGIISNIHTSTFDIDETALITGMGLFAYQAIQELNA